MFVDFFYLLKKVGIPVSPTSFLRLQQALSLGLINSVDDFYTGARSILVKSERYFDLYDQVFAHRFQFLVSRRLQANDHRRETKFRATAPANISL
jgi:uncharacterized protein with von Willebrand factor type A (vWA) domain